MMSFSPLAASRAWDTDAPGEECMVTKGVWGNQPTGRSDRIRGPFMTGSTIPPGSKIPGQPAPSTGLRPVARRGGGIGQTDPLPPGAAADQPPTPGVLISV